MPTTSVEKRARHAAACTTVTSPRASSPAVSSGSLTTSAAAPAAAAWARKRWPSVRSPGRAKKTLPGLTRRESTAAPRIGRAEDCRSVPPTAAASSRASSTGTPGAMGGGLGASFTIVGHSRTVASTPQVTAARRLGRRDAEDVDGVERDAPEELKRRDAELEFALPDDLRPRVADAHGDDRVRPVLPDEADEAEVECQGHPVLALAIPDLGRAGLAADRVAGDERAIGVPRDAGHDVRHEVGQLGRQLRVDDRLGRRPLEALSADAVHEGRGHPVRSE